MYIHFINIYINELHLYTSYTMTKIGYINKLHV